MTPDEDLLQHAMRFLFYAYEQYQGSATPHHVIVQRSGDSTWEVDWNSENLDLHVSRTGEIAGQYTGRNYEADLAAHTFSRDEAVAMAHRLVAAIGNPAHGDPRRWTRVPG
jgi:hypothetical protein